MIPRQLTVDLPSLLATLYAPLQPIIKKIRFVRRGERAYSTADVLVPPGYVAELVTSGLTAPVHGCFAPDGRLYVTESGHKSDSPPRLVEVDTATGEHRLVAELGGPEWPPSGAATGATWLAGSLYVAVTDRIVRVDPVRGTIEDVVTGLPGRGDHHANHPLAGPDGKLYWGQGTATNMAVVGPDNFAFEWLPKYPDMHDVPAHDVVLAGRNFEMSNVLGNPLEKVRTGAFVPFGTETQPGQVIAGSPKATGAVLRADPATGDVEAVAWGLRNPYGLSFHPDGRLYATEHGSDERGARFIIDDLDDLYEIIEGAWYGWPDFASGVRLDDPKWGAGGQHREPVLAEHPTESPPRPVATFPTHAAANGFDFSRDAGFGFVGEAFVALFGDLAPVTTPRQVVPAGFKVVRVDPASGEVTDFAVNRVQGPASKLFHGGFERPSHCAFGPDGNLYVVDFGEIKIAPEKGGIRIKQLTGAVWRIRRLPNSEAGTAPPPPVRVPFYPLQALAVVGAVVALVAGVAVAARRLLRRR